MTDQYEVVSQFHLELNWFISLLYCCPAVCISIWRGVWAAPSSNLLSFSRAISLKPAGKARKSPAMPSANEHQYTAPTLLAS